jgi:hypothetical protein
MLGLNNLITLMLNKQQRLHIKLILMFNEMLGLSNPISLMLNK